MNSKARSLSFLTIILMLTTIVYIQTQSGENQPSVYEQEFVNYQNSKLPESKYFENYATLSAPEKSAVIFPILTQSAYAWDGIHDFYQGYCSDCITVPIDNHYAISYGVGGNAFRVLEFLGYDVIDDLDVDKNPEILEKYEKIILLHNEYATENEFQAIQNHKNVVYLYPNSFSSKVEVDYINHEMTLINGPGYPDDSVKSGFDWKYDNSYFVTNLECQEWNFYPVGNGHMLNCYPEYAILDDDTILKTIKEL